MPVEGVTRVHAVGLCHPKNLSLKSWFTSAQSVGKTGLLRLSSGDKITPCVYILRTSIELKFCVPIL